MFDLFIDFMKKDFKSVPVGDFSTRKCCPKKLPSFFKMLF